MFDRGGSHLASGCETICPFGATTEEAANAETHRLGVWSNVPCAQTHRKRRTAPRPAHTFYLLQVHTNPVSMGTSRCHGNAVREERPDDFPQCMFDPACTRTRVAYSSSCWLSTGLVGVSVREKKTKRINALIVTTVWNFGTCPTLQVSLRQLH